jgi:glycerophosphoryl diester phosphodiesterase
MRIPLPAAFLTMPLAHRALHDATLGRPENTRAAMLSAIAAGYAIETDVQCSRDGQAMVFHDHVLDRLTDETGHVKDRTAAELTQIKLRHSDETIPTLREILALVDGRVPLLIEIKDQTQVLADTDPVLETALARDLQSYGGPVALMSFNPHVVAHLAGLCPHIPRGLTTGAFIPRNWPLVPTARLDQVREIPDYDRVQASFLSHKRADLTRPRVLELKRQGAAILCWTVKSARMEQEARQIAQNITFEGYLAAHPA